MIGTVADGGIGPNTLKKLGEYVEKHGIGQCIEDFQGARQDYYEKLSTFATFGKGWTRRVDETTELAVEMIS
jgi:lysozyme family protein